MLDRSILFFFVEDDIILSFSYTAVGVLLGVKDLIVFEPNPDRNSREWRSNGLRKGAQAHIIPRRASSEVKSAIRQYVFCACESVGSLMVEVAWMRYIVMPQILR